VREGKTAVSAEEADDREKDRRVSTDPGGGEARKKTSANRLSG